MSARWSVLAQNCTWGAKQSGPSDHTGGTRTTKHHSHCFFIIFLSCFTLNALITIFDFFFCSSRNILFSTINVSFIKGILYDKANFPTSAPFVQNGSVLKNQSCGFKHLDDSAHCRERGVTSQNTPVRPLKTQTNNFNQCKRNTSLKITGFQMSESTLELRVQVTAIFAFSSAGRIQTSLETKYKMTKHLVVNLGTLLNSFSCFFG